MEKFKVTPSKIQIDIDKNKLNAAQIRLIKTLNHTLIQTITTLEEKEFFDSSAEFMRLCASLIKQSRFSNSSSSDDKKIPYAKQALEYAVDVLSEHITQAKVVTYDN